MSYDIYIVEPTKYRGGEIMAQKKFLVTGATGDTGGYTVEQLLERGHAVRALAHREDDRSKRLERMGAEVVIGDLLKFNDVRAAMQGVRDAYFCYPIRPGILQASVGAHIFAICNNYSCNLNFSRLCYFIGNYLPHNHNEVVGRSGGILIKGGYGRRIG